MKRVAISILINHLTPNMPVVSVDVFDDDVDVFDDDDENVLIETFPSTMYQAFSCFIFWSSDITIDGVCKFQASGLLTNEQIDSLRISAN